VARHSGDSELFTSWFIGSIGWWWRVCLTVNHVLRVCRINDEFHHFDSVGLLAATTGNHSFRDQPSAYLFQKGVKLIAVLYDLGFTDLVCLSHVDHHRLVVALTVGL
jgi:hypothetical protein